MSRSAKSDSARRADLERAIAQTTRGETISLIDLSAFWGVTKARFCNYRDEASRVVNWPAGKTVNQQLVYPRLQVLKAMQAYLTRNDAVQAERQAKFSRLMGQTSEGGAPSSGGDMLPPSELLKIDQLASNLEARKVRNGELIRREDVTAAAGKVFSLLSRRLANLGTQADPNGKLPGDVRDKIEKTGHALLLRIHAEMKDMLAADVEPEPDRTPAPRKRTGKPQSR